MREMMHIRGVHPKGSKHLRLIHCIDHFKSMQSGDWQVSLHGATPHFSGKYVSHHYQVIPSSENLMSYNES